MMVINDIHYFVVLVVYLIVFRLFSVLAHAYVPGQPSRMSGNKKTHRILSCMSCIMFILYRVLVQLSPD